MVRIKHRYLLVKILFPPTASPSTADEGPLATPPILLIHRPTPATVTLQSLLRAIRDQIGQLYGDYGVGITASDLSIKYFSPLTSTFILRCPRACYRLVWAALALMTRLPLPAAAGKENRPGRRDRADEASSCVMRVVRVSGTIRKAEQEAVRRAKQDILAAKASTGEGVADTRPGLGLGALDAILRMSEDEGVKVQGIGDEHDEEEDTDELDDDDDMES